MPLAFLTHRHHYWFKVKTYQWSGLSTILSYGVGHFRLPGIPNSANSITTMGGPLGFRRQDLRPYSKRFTRQSSARHRPTMQLRKFMTLDVLHYANFRIHPFASPPTVHPNSILSRVNFSFQKLTLLFIKSIYNLATKFH